MSGGRGQLQQHSIYDAVIVGAGPAGCMAALSAPAGMRILLVDRLPAPRDIICGGILQPDVVKWLAGYGLPPSIYCSPGKIKWLLYDLELGRLGYLKDSWYLNIDRYKFDKWMLEAAVSRPDVDFLPQTCFLSVQKGDGSKLVVSLVRGDQLLRVKTHFLIGADGATSSVRRFIGITPLNFWITLQETVKTEGCRVDRFLAFIDRNIDFYGWVIPKDDDLLIGIGYDSSTSAARARFQSYRQMLKERYGIFGATAKRLRARPAIRLKSTRELCSGRGNILLVGEAAGLLTAWNGEGISYAISSGAMAGSSLSAPDPPRTFRKKLRGIIPRLTLDLAVRKLMKSPKARLLAAKAYSRASFDKI